MITVERVEIKSNCNCSKPQLFFKLNFPIAKEHVKKFATLGFTYLQSFYDAGILNMYNSNLTITCPFGNNTLQIKCKGNNCQELFNELEKAIVNLDI